MKRLVILLVVLPIAAYAGPIDLHEGSDDSGIGGSDSIVCDGEDDTAGGCEIEMRGFGRNLEKILATGMHDPCFDCGNPGTNANAWIMRLIPLVSEHRQNRWIDPVGSSLASSTSLSYGFQPAFDSDFDDGRPYDLEERPHEVPEPSTLALLALGLAAIGFARTREVAQVRAR